MQVTFYNAKGDPVTLKDTEANRTAMKKAGFSTTDSTAVVPARSSSTRDSGRDKKSTKT